MRLIIVFIAIAVVAMGATVGIQATLEANQTTTSIDNETWTPDAPNITELQDSNLDGADYNDTVTVRNSSDVVMSNQTDYEWIEHNGTVRALSGGDLDGEPSANISYGYDRPPEDQLEMAHVIAHIPMVGGLMLLFVPFLFLLKLMGGG